MPARHQPPLAHIRAQVRERIAQRGYSVRSVAKAAHVPHETLSKWLVGTRSTLPIESLRRVAMVLGWALVVPAPRLTPLQSRGTAVAPAAADPGPDAPTAVHTPPLPTPEPTAP